MSPTVGTDSATAVLPFKAKLTVRVPRSSAEATWSPDSDTDTLTFSGLSTDSTGLDAVSVNAASVPSTTSPSPVTLTVAGLMVNVTGEDHRPDSVAFTARTSKV